MTFRTIDNTKNKTIINNNNKYNYKERKITMAKSLKIIPFTKNEFNDVRFLHCKNEFNDNISEMENPIKLIMEKNSKRYKLPKLQINY